MSVSEQEDQRPRTAPTAPYGPGRPRTALDGPIQPRMAPDGPGVRRFTENEEFPENLTDGFCTVGTTKVH